MYKKYLVLELEIERHYVPKYHATHARSTHVQLCNMSVSNPSCVSMVYSIDYTSGIVHSAIASLMEKATSKPTRIKIVESIDTGRVEVELETCNKSSSNS